MEKRDRFLFRKMPQMRNRGTPGQKSPPTPDTKRPFIRLIVDYVFYSPMGVVHGGLVDGKRQILSVKFARVCCSRCAARLDDDDNNAPPTRKRQPTRRRRRFLLLLLMLMLLRSSSSVS